MAKLPYAISLKSFQTLAVLFAVLVLSAQVCAQQKDVPVPYDSIQRQGVSYAGPGRESQYDLLGPVIHIGVIAPIHGPEKRDGEAIVRAAQMALKDESNTALPGGLRLALAVGDESGPAWGHAADQIIHLVMEQKVVAIITSASGDTAHLCEQVCNRIGVPVLTLSTDTTTTQLGLPWIVRLGPSDAAQAKAIARDIYQVRGFRRVLLVAENDHDGRIGFKEFMKAAGMVGSSTPASMMINPLQPDTNAILAAVKNKIPEAIVVWARPENARKLLLALSQAGDHNPVYLSGEAAQGGFGTTFPSGASRASSSDFEGVPIYTVEPTQAKDLSGESFRRRYFSATGMRPTATAAEAYDAVRLIARSIREAGPNRARVRDRILSVRNFGGASGTIWFDEQGNDRAGVRLVRQP